MSKTDKAQNQTNILPQKGKEVKHYRTTGRLTPEQREFLGYYGLLIQHFNVPSIAKAFGVTRQSVESQIDKKRKIFELPKTK